MRARKSIDLKQIFRFPGLGPHDHDYLQLNLPKLNLRLVRTSLLMFPSDDPRTIQLL